MRIADRPVGVGHPVLVCAEIGSNHNRDLGMALRLIDEAADAGCDAVKFQTFSAKGLYSRYTPQFKYLEQVSSASTYDLIESLEMPAGWNERLMEHAKQRGLIWFSTPTDRTGVDELDQLGVPVFKVSSFEAMDTPFVRYVASKGKPMILSTGMMNVREIRQALEACQKVPVALLQCTSLYPAPFWLVNLRAMGEMAFWFRVPVGLSDHTTGIHIAVAAIAAGATIIEKHFTLSRDLPGPDHAHSIVPAEMREMVRQIREVEWALGNGAKDGPAPEEAEMYRLARRSVVATQDIPAGTVLTAEMLTTKRPGYGIPPSDLDTLPGRVAKVNIREDDVVVWEMIC